MYIVTALLGFVLLIAPFLFNFTADTAALWTSVIAGGVLMLDSLLEALVNDRDLWEYWLAGGVGLLAIVIPLVFGFSTVAIWTSVVVGIITVAAAGSRILTGAQFKW